MSTDLELTSSSRTHAGVLVSDMINTYYKVLANPASAILFFISTIEFFLLITGNSKSIYDFILQAARTAAGPDPPNVVVQLLLFLETTVTTLNSHRLFIALSCRMFIPVAENQRDYALTLGFILLVYVFTFSHPLQMLFYSEVWIQFSNLSYVHRVMLLIFSMIVVYYDVLDLKTGGSVHKFVLAVGKEKQP